MFLGMFVISNSPIRSSLGIIFSTTIYVDDPVQLLPTGYKIIPTLYSIKFTTHYTMILIHLIIRKFPFEPSSYKVLMPPTSGNQVLSHVSSPKTLQSVSRVSCFGKNPSLLCPPVSPIYASPPPSPTITYNKVRGSSKSCLCFAQHSQFDIKSPERLTCWTADIKICRRNVFLEICMDGDEMGRSMNSEWDE